MSEDVNVDGLVKPKPGDLMTNHAEQHSLIADIIVAKDKLQQTIAEKVEEHEHDYAPSNHKHQGPITWKYIGENTTPKENGDFSVRHSNGTTKIEIHDKSKNGVYWEAGKGRETDIDAGGILGIFNYQGEMEICGEFNYVECSRKGKAYSSVSLTNAHEDHELNIGEEYLINLPGLLPQFPF